MTTGPVLSRKTIEQLVPGDAAPLRVPAINEPVSIKTLADAERAHIMAVLRKTNWVIGGPRGAAAHLGLARTTLMGRMQRLGISSGAPQGRPAQPIRLFLRVVGGSSARLEDEPAVDLRVVEPIAAERLQA